MLAASTCEGKIHIWNTESPKTPAKHYETKGSFGMCVDIVSIHSAFPSLVDVLTLYH